MDPPLSFHASTYVKKMPMECLFLHHFQSPSPRCHKVSSTYGIATGAPKVNSYATRSPVLCIRKSVIIWQVSIPEPATLDLDYLEDCSMSDLMPVVVHDAKQQMKDFMCPHQHVTLTQFMCNIYDPHKIQCILDIPFSQGGLPLFVSTLDHGIINGWNQSTVNCPIHDNVHPDNFTTGRCVKQNVMSQSDAIAMPAIVRADITIAVMSENEIDASSYLVV
ncbi:hypothetical protein EV424DRAFT_1342350 [Suillus variegatus]|nr:hypothetical protein EV424DRAFT_1342350 [Suillus variegatus]